MYEMQANSIQQSDWLSSKKREHLLVSVYYTAYKHLESIKVYATPIVLNSYREGVLSVYMTSIHFWLKPNLLLYSSSALGTLFFRFSFTFFFFFSNSRYIIHTNIISISLRISSSTFFIGIWTTLNITRKPKMFTNTLVHGPCMLWIGAKVGKNKSRSAWQSVAL